MWAMFKALFFLSGYFIVGCDWWIDNPQMLIQTIKYVGSKRVDSDNKHGHPYIVIIITIIIM